ncbi:MAG: hypothetical protein JKY67_20320 [Pseudomonadales bacterium]|nr:hypothetical protein [Pseudomonadales bacterium]
MISFTFDYRIPAASWVGLDSKSTMQNHGIGLVNTQVYDTEGMVGSVTQAIMPQPILVE